jgi:arylsulfatase A-like enzyme
MAEPPAETQTRAVSMSGKTLVVTIDRLPAWILPAYGSSWVSTPALNALAGRGIVFDGLVATGSDPHEVLADLLGGMWAAPAEARVGSLVTDDPSILEHAGQGLETRCIEAATPAATATDEDGTILARLFDAAAEVVAAGRHACVWCHAGSLGWAWDAPDGFREAYVDPDDPPPPPGAAVPELAVSADTDPDLIVGIRQVFAGQLTLLDRRLSRLLAGVADGWTVLVVGVRGLPLGLHGRLGVGPLPPFGELIRLPAILVDANARMAGQRYGGLVTPADLGATLVELAGGEGAAEPDGPLPGRSLAGLFRNWSVTERDRVIVTTPEGVAVVTPHWHLTLSAGAGEVEPRLHLFAKPDDYFELCDVANRCPDVVDALREVAAAAAAGDAARAWRAPLGRGGDG